MSRLDDIVASKRREIAGLREQWDDDLTSRRLPLDACHALARPRGAPLRLIAEVKFKSPSAGELSRRLDAGARARSYADGGAAMVSVLCDGPFFGGGFDDLAAAGLALRNARREVPLLAKEFVLDEVQLTVARAKGADAVLLIARLLDPAALQKLVRAARARGLEPLVEVVTEDELAAALATSARLIGVNARDLDTLAIDRARAEQVLTMIPRDRIAIHLSGLKAPADVAAVARGRADAALIGEALMREDDPAPLLASLVAATRLDPVTLD